MVSNAGVHAAVTVRVAHDRVDRSVGVDVGRGGVEGAVAVRIGVNRRYSVGRFIGSRSCDLEFRLASVGRGFRERHGCLVWPYLIYLLVSECLPGSLFAGRFGVFLQARYAATFCVGTFDGQFRFSSQGCDRNLHAGSAFCAFDADRIWFLRCRPPAPLPFSGHFERS